MACKRKIDDFEIARNKNCYTFKSRIHLKNICFFFIDETFTAKSINHKNFKTNLQNKKSRMLQIKKPQETLNKENKDVIEKSTNYLYKILLNNINIKENEKHKCLQKSVNKETYNSESKHCEQVDVKVLGDHSYSERLDDKVPNRKGSPVTPNVVDDTTREEKVSDDYFINYKE